VVGARIAGNVTHAEEHHGDLPVSWPRTSGRVVSIMSAFSRHAPVRGQGESRAPPGTTAEPMHEPGEVDCLLGAVQRAMYPPSM